MVSRLLKRFADQGILRLGREQIEIIDAGALRSLTSDT
jgi:CRP/FNR family transcriptional regulator